MLAVCVLRRFGLTLAGLALAPIRYLSSDLLEGRGPGTRAEQSDAMPSWTPGNEFEAARKRVLSERAAAGSSN